MVYYKYYVELKNRLILLLLTWISVTTVCYFYQEILIFEIIDLTNYAGLSKKNPYFIFSNVTDIFSVSLHLIFFVSNQCLFIFFMYHFLLFFSTGLYYFELKNFVYILKISFFYWILTIIFINFFLFPFCWNFFLSFHDQNNLDSITLFFEVNFKEYVYYYTQFYYLCIFNFQISCGVLLGINRFNNQLKKVKTFRKMFYLLFVIFSTVITPPDLFSQLFLSFCLIFLYEFLIILKIFDKTII